MARGLLVGDDARVAAWAFRAYKFQPTKFDLAIGVVDPGGALVGAVLFQGLNGSDVQLAYYGRRTLSPGIVRGLARASLGLGVARVSIVTSKKNKRLIRAAEKLGFVREGVARRYYGIADTDRNAGTRLVMFKERLEEIAH